MTNNWHVITVTHGGTVSILKNLDETTAKKAAERLNPYRGLSQQMNSIGIMISASDSDIKHIYVLGPEESA